MLKFSLIENGGIFIGKFSPLAKNNEIAFPSRGEEIVAIYGPNGTGKTSLVKVLCGEKGTKVEFEFDGSTYSSGSTVFHVINDQNNRNIIAGETKDFFLGDNIKQEFELQEFLTDARASVISEIISKLKSNHGISTMSNPLLTLIVDAEVAEMVKDIVNSRSKGSRFETEAIFTKFAAIPLVSQDVSEQEQAKLVFLQADYVAEAPIIKQIEKLAKKAVEANPQVHEVEENSEAIRILERFRKDQCVVCDSENIDWKTLLSAKTDNRAKVIEALDKDAQALIRQIISLVPDHDPFSIKMQLLEAIAKGDKSIIDTLVADFAAIKKIFERQIMNELAAVFEGSDLPSKLEEYQKLCAEKPEITEEDMLFIEEIISNSMRKRLSLRRDEADNKNLKITLSDKEFLGKTRDKLPLSTGEQNFLSLTFEFMKARNSQCPIVVIDDPVSSFDSIYKNKVVYAMVKMLHQKKRIVLTHNTDLLRLLDAQYRKCYKLYLLNNTEGEETGFVPIASREQEMLISLEKLLAGFRGAIFDHIKDIEFFLISMIPFMRGYANIKNDKVLFNSLSQVMHGYKSEKIDIAQAYIELFGNIDSKIPTSYQVSVADILAKNVDDVDILDKSQYPLLNKTLRHSFTYLFLRLLVEKALVDRFRIDTNRYTQLGEIISAAYPNEHDEAQIRNRIRLTSKKTLLNEFNHFEGNLSIFQPAVDITDQALVEEKSDIINFLGRL